MKQALSKLEEVDLRDYWTHEEYDFTPWLASEDNIAQLGEAVGMDLEVISKEESVGSYSADILCKDSLNGHFVVIENQLEITDHKHLGQIATYGAGLNASSCIWIAKSFTEEHRAAVDWLNAISDDEHNFFGIEIKLYKIDNSPLAPIFNVVAKPNNWSKSIRSNANNTPLTDTKKLQQEYWAGFGAYVQGRKSSFRTHKPAPQHWTNISIGNSAISMSLSVDSRTKTIKIWLDIKGTDPKANYDRLYESLYNKSISEISPNIRWDRLDGKKMSFVELKRDADFSNKQDWNNQFEWFFEYVEKFVTIFKPAVKGYK